MSNNNFQIFLCHASEDKSKIRSLYSWLRKDGRNIWLDEEKLLPGQDWDFEIRKAIKDSAIVLVCLSENSITKEGYVQKEIKFALDIADEKPEGTIYIVPIRLEKCEVPKRLINRHWVDIFQEHGYQKLGEAIHEREKNLLQEETHQVNHPMISFIYVINAEK